MLNEPNNIFLNKVSVVVEEARENVKAVVNVTMVYTYPEIGRMIVEEEQSGSNRAELIYQNDYHGPIAFQAERCLYCTDDKLYYEYDRRCFDMGTNAIQRMYSPDQFPSLIFMEKQ